MQNDPSVYGEYCKQIYRQFRSLVEERAGPAYSFRFIQCEQEAAKISDHQASSTFNRDWKIISMLFFLCNDITMSHKATQVWEIFLYRLFTVQGVTFESQIWLLTVKSLQHYVCNPLLATQPSTQTQCKQANNSRREKKFANMHLEV